MLGVSITPVAFLVVQNDTVKLLPVCHSSAIDKLLDYVPDLVDKANCFLNKTMNNMREDKKEEKKRENQIKSKIQKEIEKERNKDDEKEFEINQEQERTPISKIRPKKTKPQEEDYEYEYDEQEDMYDDEE